MKHKYHVYLSVICFTILLINVFSCSLAFAADKQKEQSKFDSAKEVLDAIGTTKPMISNDGQSIILPESPDPNYEVTLYGSDNKQIISLDSKFYQPVSDMDVNVLYKVVNKADPSDFAVSDKDISLRVKGSYSIEEGDNPVPNVIPGLREWKGYKGNFKLDQSSRIVIESGSKDSLKDTATQIQTFFKNMLKKDLSILIASEPKQGDIFIKLDAEQEQLGKEGYLLEINDFITITAPDKQGILYGGTSITQIIYQSEGKDSVPKGLARDYPKYEIRSGMIDVGRMYIPLEYIQEMTEYMAWFKLNEMHMHINDFRAGANYDAFRVESKKYPKINAKDGYYTQEEYIAYQKAMQKYGIDIVTEIDTPYHAESFRAVNPEMMLPGTRGYLDITTPEKREIVYPFIESLFDEFLGKDINDKNRVFLSSQFHIGTDEYNKEYSEEMRAYTDHFIRYVNNKGYHSRLWGSIGKNGFDGTTPVSNEATMNIWAPYWSDVKEMYDLGYDIINTNGTDLYIVPLGNAGFPDYLNIKEKYETWEVNKFLNTKSSGKGSAEMPLAHPQTKGAAFALWNDITAYTGGLSSFDIFDRFKDGVMLVAEKTWYGEKTKGQTSDEFMQRVSLLQNKTPLSNPGRHVESKTQVVVDYDFESIKNNEVPDLSGNDYHAKIFKGSVENSEYGQALKLNGDGYLELPIKSIGFPYSVSFDIKLEPGSKNDAKLFEGEDGAFYLNFESTGKLGYERNEKTSEASLNKFENYKFTHDYSIPENKWHNIIIIGDNRETSIYVDGKKVSTSRQANKLNGRTNDSSTFVLPLEKIGNGVKGLIDNLKIVNKGFENSIQKNIALGQKATASSEYDTNQRAEFMLDGNFGTRWGSNYKGKTEAQKDDEWVMIELDDSYDLNTIKIFWETARAEKYTLLASIDGENFKPVDKYTYSPTDGSIDTINLKNVKAKYLKIDMDKRKSSYGYSIFEIEVYANTDFSVGQKYITEAENLITIIPPDFAGEKERNSLIEAKEELKRFLDEEHPDMFTFDLLVGNLTSKLNAFKNTISSPKNLAVDQKVRASTQYNSTTQKAALATDGDITTRWGSAYKNIPDVDNQWIEIEFDKITEFDTIVIHWENARAAKYDLLVSNDGENYEKVYSHTHQAKDGLVDVINLKDVEAKYVKVAMSQRTTNYGYSIYEIEAYKFTKATSLMEEADKLLKLIPDVSSGQNQRMELINTMDKMKSYFAKVQKDGVSYHTLTYNLEQALETFKNSIVKVEKIKIDKENIELYVNDSIKLNVIVEPENAYNKDVIWTSSNEKIATVDEDGTVHGVKEGIVEIKATSIDGKHEAVSRVTVKEIVDKSALAAAIEEANKKQENDYTKASWAVFQTALDKAKSVYNNAEVTQETVDQAYAELDAAIKQLQEKPVKVEVDKSALAAAIEEANKKQENDYTKASWAVFQTALNKAKSVYNDAEVTQETVDQAYAELDAAIKQLQEKPVKVEVDKSALAAAIEEANKKQENDYTKASWAVFQTALNKAKSVYNDAEVTQETVDQAYAELVAAIKQLQEKPVKVEVDKSTLAAAIEEANKKQENDYTKASWAVFQTALNKAKSVYNDAEVTQETVDQAYAELAAAIKQLQEKPVKVEVDKSALAAAIEEANKKQENDYTKASWAVFQTALDKAKSVYNDAEVTQEIVDQAYAELAAAIKQLQEKPVKVDADKSALAAAVEEANKKQKNDYTKASWAVFQTALDKAKSVLNNPEATQSEVDSTTKNLKTAMDNLKEITKSKQNLPNTSTGILNIFFAGIILILSALTILFIRKRES